MSMAATTPACHGGATVRTRAGGRTPIRTSPQGRFDRLMRDELLLEVLHDTATAVRVALDALDDWGSARPRPGQYPSALAADEAALAVHAKDGRCETGEEGAE